MMSQSTATTSSCTEPPRTSTAANSALTRPTTDTMPGSRRTKQTRPHRDSDALLRHNLNQIPIPQMTVHQKTKFLDHIAKVFFFILQEFKNNQQNIPPHRNIPDFPEAFHRPLFDLQVLTDQFMDNITETWELVSCTSWLLQTQKMMTNCYGSPSKNYIADVPLQKDLLLPHSLNGYGNIIKTPYGDNLLNLEPFKLSLISRSLMNQARKAKTSASKQFQKTDLDSPPL